MSVSTTFPKPVVYYLEVRAQQGKVPIRRDSLIAIWPLVTDIATPRTGIFAGKAATITIVGRGKPCPSLTVDFGDGTGLITLSNVALPLPLQHTFAKAGSFTASVRTTTRECTGQASRIVSVGTVMP